MRSGFHSESGPNREGEGRTVEQLRVRRAQRDTRDEGYRVKARARRRGGRGRRRGRRESSAPPPQKPGFFAWLKSLFGFGRKETEKRPRRGSASLDQQEKRVLEDFQKQFGITFRDPGLLKLALTHRSYLSVTGQGPRESNERLEFLGDSVLGLVTSEYLYRRHPDEHEGQLTKTKSLLVSKAILSRRALRMGLGRFVLMSHSEVESGGRQRLSILADAFESVLGAVYLDQGFEVAREYIHKHLLAESDSIVADKRHTNYKSHLQEYVQSTYRTHPVYRIRSENGPDHSKYFMVEVMVGRRTLGEGRGHNKKEAEQAAARDALERVEKSRGGVREPQPEPTRERAPAVRAVERDEEGDAPAESRRRRRGRRGGRGRGQETEAIAAPVPVEDETDLELVGDAGEAADPVEERLERAAEAPAELAELEPEDDDADDELEEDDADFDAEDDAEDEDEDEDDDDDDDDDEIADAAAAELDDEGALDDLEDDEVVEEIVDEPAERPRAMLTDDAKPAPVVSAPVATERSATPAAQPSAPPPAAPMAWGRSSRRATGKPAPAADKGPAPGPMTEPVPPPAASLPDEPVEQAAQEALHVDPYDLHEAPEEGGAVEVVPPVEEDSDDDEVDARIEEMERAMANFGQRKGGGTPSRRGQGFGRRNRGR
ncbi:MAG: ribonuclease III [Candidatus Eisenbacteria bacterium]